MNNIMVAPHHAQLVGWRALGSAGSKLERHGLQKSRVNGSLGSAYRFFFRALEAHSLLMSAGQPLDDVVESIARIIEPTARIARSSLAVLRSTGKGRYEEVVEVVVVEAVVVPVHMALDQVMVQEVALEMVSTMVVAEVVEEEAMVVEEGQATVALARDIDPEVDMDMAVVGKEEESEYCCGRRHPQKKVIS
ncbi:hypothetical protein CRG98_014223 [Punica granatum]|uniref:Uncharacterized protein n=1 Tax=Punica granatum TaxID=22663 RepID=A0A2I0KA02_PUNGR|nr:hypothetical protein CRG98_014223 [Punica granatum]